MYTPYDWNEAIRHRSEYIEARLVEGSPVAAVSCREGVLLLTVRAAQRKIFEVYDRLAFSGVGQHSDIEAVRLAAIDFAHQEGFTRSPDDVTLGRVVAAISPALKKAFGDPFAAPLVLRALFAEVGKTPEQDALTVMNYDGEFQVQRGAAAVAGSTYAEEQMAEILSPLAVFAGAAPANREAPPLSDAAAVALRAWAAGRLHRRPADEDEPAGPPDYDAVLSDALATGEVEAVLLERQTTRENRFRPLGRQELGERGVKG